MPATELMGWNKNQQRWFKRLPKQFGSKIIAVGCPELEKRYPELMRGRTQEGSRAAANQWYRDKLDSIEPPADTRPNAAEWQERLKTAKENHRWAVANEREQDITAQAEQIAAIEEILRGEDLPHPAAVYSPEVQTPPAYARIVTDGKDEVWADRRERSSKKADLAHSIAALIDKFGKFAKSNAKALGVTYDRACNIRGEVDHFGNWIAAKVAAEEINDDIREVKGHTMLDFKQHLLDRIEKGEIGDYRARDVMVTTKRFVTWCDETMEVIDRPPRNLHSRDLTITVTPKGITLFSDAEVKKLLAVASERQRLYYLLMLNTGMTGYEIALLDDHDEAKKHDGNYFHTPRIDWTKGTIKRKRTKTKKHKQVPTVEHKLWAETLRLLKIHADRSGKGSLLRNEDGGPLVSKTVEGDKKQKRNDCIGLQYRRLRLAEKLPKKDLKALRKTASTKLDDNDEFARYAEFFLGHSPKGTADRHYVEPSQARFDAAMMWLEAVAIEKWGVGQQK